MAEHRDPVVAKVKRVRRKISHRLWKAREEGRLHDELLAMGREARRAYREAVNGTSNGLSRRSNTNGRARRIGR